MNGSQWVVVWDTCALMKDLWVGYQVTHHYGCAQYLSPIITELKRYCTYAGSCCCCCTMCDVITSLSTHSCTHACYCSLLVQCCIIIRLLGMCCSRAIHGIVPTTCADKLCERTVHSLTQVSLKIMQRLSSRPAFMSSSPAWYTPS